MKKYLALLFLLIFAGQAFGQATTPLPLPADRIVSGTITGTTCNGDVTAAGCIVINTQGTSTVSIIISGGWATYPITNYLSFEGTTSDSGGWGSVPMTDTTSLISSPNTATSGFFIGGVGGYRKFRVRLSGSFNANANIVLNASAGQTPDFGLNRSFIISQSLLEANNSAGFKYVEPRCKNAKTVLLSINATGENPIVASINISSSSSGPWVNYKKINTGYDIPAIFNGEISAPYFQIEIPNDGSEAGDISVQGGCKQ